MILPKDKIGYIRRTEDNNGKYQFKFIEAKIKQIRFGKTRTSVYSDRFRALDAEDLEFNTKLMIQQSGLVLVGEPFITNQTLSDHIRKVVDYWNENGATSLLDIDYKSEIAEGEA